MLFHHYKTESCDLPHDLPPDVIDYHDLVRKYRNGTFIHLSVFHYNDGTRATNFLVYRDAFNPWWRWWHSLSPLECTRSIYRFCHPTATMIWDERGGATIIKRKNVS